MNQERILKVLRAANGTFVFKVAKDANKLEIKKAVEALFEVKVKAVRTANMKGKSKFFGRVAGKRADWKKAYVSLEEGQDIDFLGAE